MRGTIRKDQDGWSVVYFVTAEDCDAVARVEVNLHEDNHNHVKHDEIVDFDIVKVKGKSVARLTKGALPKREINGHLKHVIL